MCPESQSEDGINHRAHHARASPVGQPGQTVYAHPAACGYMTVLTGATAYASTTDSTRSRRRRLRRARRPPHPLMGQRLGTSQAQYALRTHVPAVPIRHGSPVLMSARSRRIRRGSAVVDQQLIRYRGGVLGINTTYSTCIKRAARGRNHSNSARSEVDRRATVRYMYI